MAEKPYENRSETDLQISGGGLLVALTHDEIATWLAHRYPSTEETKVHTEPALLWWLDTMPVPLDYPSTNKSLLNLLNLASETAEHLLQTLVTPETKELFCVLGSQTLNGPAYAGLILSHPRLHSLKSRRNQKILTDGFRDHKTPPNILIRRFFDPTPLSRVVVDRADHDWVHGRGQDPTARVLRQAKVVLLGCGSIGGFVARMLAEAGVGSFVLVDPDVLSWANVGRHVLGGDSVGYFKASSLRDKLKQSFPHLRSVVCHTSPWQQVLRKCCDLDGPSVLVSTMGSWDAESAVNAWHLESGRHFPVVYGWTEAHASAGHAVLVSSNGGCLQCGLDHFGTPRLRVTSWEANQTLRTEPACGAVYQPYGPIELAFITSLIAETIVDGILGKHNQSTHRIWVGRTSQLQSLGGYWTEEWSSIAGDRQIGAFVEELPWPINSGCVECQIPLQ